MRLDQHPMGTYFSHHLWKKASTRTWSLFFIFIIKKKRNKLANKNRCISNRYQQDVFLQINDPPYLQKKGKYVRIDHIYKKPTRTIHGKY